MAGYYDREGKPITQGQWSATLGDRVYQRVLETTLPNGIYVSTVWLGLDHQFECGGPPLIFETMAFPADGEFEELICRRYATEEEARHGHEEIAKQFAERPHS